MHRWTRGDLSKGTGNINPLRLYRRAIPIAGKGSLGIFSEINEGSFHITKRSLPLSLESKAAIGYQRLDGFKRDLVRGV
jgi:hypothetical protein